MVFACSPTKKASFAASPKAAATAAIPEGKQDGESLETAVFIKEKSTIPGIAAENAWIAAHYPGSRKVRQQLVHEKQRSYDIITIELPSGKTKDIYFDISGFFGTF